MAVYMIVEAKEIFNAQNYAEYVKAVPPMVRKFGGKYLARGGKVSVVAGDWMPGRVVIIEFPDMDKFNAWWDSPEYKAVKHLRENGAKTNAIVVEGVTSPRGR